MDVLFRGYIGSLTLAADVPFIQDYEGVHSSTFRDNLANIHLMNAEVMAGNLKPFYIPEI